MSDVLRRPFHETLVHAIMSADLHTIDLLEALIETTDIPAGHEAIVTAIEYKAPYFGASRVDQLQNMRQMVLEQKAEAGARKH